MSARFIREWSPGSLIAALLLLSLPMLSGCAPTGPIGTLDGRVVLATGQVGNVDTAYVELLLSDPFVGRAKSKALTFARGSATDAKFSFGEREHGNFVMVVWKDQNHDYYRDKGDLVGWYNGGVSAKGKPVVTPIELPKGRSATVTIALSVMR